MEVAKKSSASRFLDHLEEWIISFMMGAATLVVFVAVAHRYLAGSAYTPEFLRNALLAMNVSWAQELCIYMFVWMAKFGAAYGVRTGIHVGVDVMINRLQEKNRNKFILFGLSAGALFTGVIAVLGARFVWENGMHYAVWHAFSFPIGELFEGPTTPDLEWPTWAVYSAIPLGSALMCFRFLQVAWSFAHGGELPHHDHSHVEGLDEETPPSTTDMIMEDGVMQGHARSAVGLSAEEWAKKHSHKDKP